MTTTKEKTQISAAVDEDTELGFGTMLIAENEDGGYEPVGIASTISEAREIASRDFQNRMLASKSGADPLYPNRYALWVRGVRGMYRTITTFEAE
jgi:hypothetical protein